MTKMTLVIAALALAAVACGGGKPATDMPAADATSAADAATAAVDTAAPAVDTAAPTGSAMP
jgi:hypothetical protein